MLRVGKGKTGIEDWSGKRRAIHYVNTQPDFLVDTERGTHLGIRDLEKAFPHYIGTKGFPEWC